jgi:hypothetical protein
VLTLVEIDFSDNGGRGCDGRRPTSRWRDVEHGEVEYNMVAYDAAVFTRRSSEQCAA